MLCCAQEAVEALLTNGADMTARDRTWQTPLHIAAAHNATECALFPLAPLVSHSIERDGPRGKAQSAPRGVWGTHGGGGCFVWGVGGGQEDLGSLFYSESLLWFGRHEV